MTAICPRLVTSAHGNMVASLPLNVVMTSDLHKQVKVNSMNTKRGHVKGGHMTGGRMVAVRPPVIGADDNHNGHSEKTDTMQLVSAGGQENTRQHRTKVRSLDKTHTNIGPIIQLTPGSWTPVLTLNDVNHPAILTTDGARGSMVLCTAEGLIPVIAPVATQQALVVSHDPCTCQIIRRHSSSSGDEGTDHRKSSRSPLRQVPEAPSRMDGLSPPPPTLQCGDVQKYENIPVPGIIPKSRATSSPTPPTTCGTHQKEVISVYSRLSSLKASSDREVIVNAEERLKSSGFYFDTVSASEAKKMLHPAEVGTFLVRISSQSSHFFALSVKTNRGTTSIRISYDNGGFRLDADPESIAKMPAFKCVVALIEYYVVQSASDARNKCVFLESNGRRDTPVILTRPYRNQPQSLKHLCRRNLHYHLSELQLEQYLDNNPASVQLRQYIQSYPYAL